MYRACMEPPLDVADLTGISLGTRHVSTPGLRVVGIIDGGHQQTFICRSAAFLPPTWRRQRSPPSHVRHDLQVALPHAAHSGRRVHLEDGGAARGRQAGQEGLHLRHHRAVPDLLTAAAASQEAVRGAGRQRAQEGGRGHPALVQLPRAVAIISHKKFANVAVQAAGMHGIPLSYVYTLGEANSRCGLQSIEGLIAQDLPFPDIPPIDTNQVVTLPFSSGTTGRPKGVELTARAMHASGIIPAYRESKTGCVLGMLPFFHIMMTMNFHVTLYLGKPMIVLPGFTPETFLKTVEKYKLDMINLAPPLVTFLAKHPIVDKCDLSHVKHVKSGGAPLGKEVERAVMQRLGIQVLQGYGMTEFVGCGCRSYPSVVRDGSSGTLHPNTELKVKDLETGEDLPANRTGELLFRTPAMMKGYYKNPDATRAAFTEDGFLRTGDLGYIDDDGFIFIVDRLKELIKYKGHQVAPAEVEDVVNSHPLVADSCCVRGRDLRTGEEIPKAFVVLKEGESLTTKALMDYVAAKVAGFKRMTPWMAVCISSIWRSSDRYVAAPIADLLASLRSYRQRHDLHVATPGYPDPEGEDGLEHAGAACARAWGQARICVWNHGQGADVRGAAPEGESSECRLGGTRHHERRRCRLAFVQLHRVSRRVPRSTELVRLIGDGALANMTVEAAYLKDLKPERVFVYGEEEGPATAESLE
ncbi:hypothetical protein ON010_g14017 [Phytophthora cinnamomi]|nr:hypothetical protein ON010_g14017 [Phytophthora cinnamomi]